MTPSLELWHLSQPIPRLLLAVLVLLPLLSGGMVHAQSVIDVAVFYTGEAREEQGGTDAIKTKIDEIVAATNMAYADSGANQTLNLVHVRETAYTESNSIDTDLGRLRDPSDGYMDDIHATRDRVWADIVMLFRTDGGIDGIAYQMVDVSTAFADNAFGATILHTHAFAHEVGHIMGLAHDRYDTCRNNSCPPTSYPYAFGYVNQEAFESGASSSKRWRSPRMPERTASMPWAMRSK